MEKIIDMWSSGWQTRVINTAIVIIASIIIYKIINYIIKKSEKNEKSILVKTNKGKTYLKLLRSVIRNIFIIITVFAILQVNGVNISSMLAGVGILGVIFGLAIQDFLKDVIRGSTILSDEYFEVGDIVTYKDIEGKVLALGLKSTKIQDLATNDVVSIANRNIEEVKVTSKQIYVRAPFPYGLPRERYKEVSNELVDTIKQNNNVIDCRFLGVAELADSSIEHLFEVTCNPQFKLQVKRDTLGTILDVFDKNGVEVPFTQIDIHNK